MKGDCNIGLPDSAEWEVGVNSGVVSFDDCQDEVENRLRGGVVNELDEVELFLGVMRYESKDWLIGGAEFGSDELFPNRTVRVSASWS